MEICTCHRTVCPRIFGKALPGFHTYVYILLDSQAALNAATPANLELSIYSQSSDIKKHSYSDVGARQLNWCDDANESTDVLAENIRSRFIGPMPFCGRANSHTRKNLSPKARDCLNISN